jgi:8-oxo-dGTP pyrophosphatase MutT (NUDIX family)
MDEQTHAVSSGGVVYRLGVTGPEVLLLRRARSGRWRLPKGGVESGETPDEAALREVAEEAGVRAEVQAHMGESNYSYHDEAKQAWIHKTVHHFLMRAEVGAAVSIEAGTFDAGGFYPLQRAMEMLHFDNEREAVRAAAGPIRVLRARGPA